MSAWASVEIKIILEKRLTDSRGERIVIVLVVTNKTQWRDGR